MRKYRYMAQSAGFSVTCGSQREEALDYLQFVRMEKLLPSGRVEHDMPFFLRWPFGLLSRHKAKLPNWQ